MYFLIFHVELKWNQVVYLYQQNIFLKKLWKFDIASKDYFT